MGLETIIKDYINDHPDIGDFILSQDKDNIFIIDAKDTVYVFQSSYTDFKYNRHTHKYINTETRNSVLEAYQNRKNNERVVCLITKDNTDSEIWDISRLIFK